VLELDAALACARAAVDALTPTALADGLDAASWAKADAAAKTSDPKTNARTGDFFIGDSWELMTSRGADERLRGNLSACFLGALGADCKRRSAHQHPGAPIATGSASPVRVVRHGVDPTTRKDQP
jgi:hypothetical protein